MKVIERFPVPHESGSAQRWLRLAMALSSTALMLACGDSTEPPEGERPLDPQLVAEGKEIFRYDSFGDEVYWSDTLRMHEVVESGVSPATALQVGLRVDADALPQGVKDAIAAGQVDLNDPAT